MQSFHRIELGSACSGDCSEDDSHHTSDRDGDDHRESGDWDVIVG